MEQMKKAFKGLFNKKKKEQPQPTATTETPSSAHPKPSETTPAAPVPASGPEPVKTEITPAASSSAHAQPESVPAPAPASVPPQGGANKDEVAALAEVKKATQSKPTSLSDSDLCLVEDEGGGSSRWRYKALNHD
jgi:hypothetical protein